MVVWELNMRTYRWDSWLMVVWELNMRTYRWDSTVITLCFVCTNCNFLHGFPANAFCVLSSMHIFIRGFCMQTLFSLITSPYWKFCVCFCLQNKVQGFTVKMIHHFISTIHSFFSTTFAHFNVEKKKEVDHIEF